MALDATIGGTSANSYLTTAEATAYFGRRLYTNDWDSAGSNQAKALQWATQLLDDYVEWAGRKKDDDQALRWPRQSVYDEDGNWVSDAIIPQAIKDATAELALALLKEDRTADPDSVGIASMSVGPLSLAFDKSDRDAYGVIPDTVIKMISAYGEVKSRGVSGAVKLART